MTTKNPHISLLIMMKDEEERLHITLNSCLGHVDSIVAYDTGSTDNTIKILKEFCEKHKLPLKLKEGVFVNFSISRNVSLVFVDSFDDIDYILLLDVSDELRGGDKLRNFCKKEMGSVNNAYLVCQEWFFTKNDKYFNTRLVKHRKGWRYNGSVHEWMSDEAEIKGPGVFKMPDDIILYQDRTTDGNKSGNRFSRDKELLLNDLNNNLTETRTLFYLAQTCACLNEPENAFYYYKLRSELEGFQEEKFHSFLRGGEFSIQLKHDWHTSLGFFMKAFEHSSRAEPLIIIAKYYNNEKKWHLAYTFIKLACSLPYPTESILFVDKYAYDYTRWHIMGIVAYYCGKFEDGKHACLKAIEGGLNIDLDKSNLIYYEKKLAELSNSKIPLNKALFIKQNVDESHKQNPNIPMNKLHKIAALSWKNRIK